MDIIGSVVYPSLDKQTPSLKDAPILAALRILKIQKLIDELNVDGVLALNGVDSRYNPDCRNFINYILFGCSNYKTGNSVKYTHYYYDTDELIILIKSKKVHIYIVPSMLDTIFPLISKIQNLELHCLDCNLSVDDSIFEDHKVYSFIGMTKGIKTVAIPYSQKNDIPFDPMSIEKWPLIQAYALENYGSNGFFGLSHDLIEFDFENEEIFSWFDTGSLKHLLTDSCELLKYHWNNMITNVINAIRQNKDIDLQSVTDPLTSYLQHGSKGGEEPLFFIEKHATTGEPLYMTCSIKEPKGSLGCGRTYFLHNNVDSADLIMISCIYDSMVMALHKTIQRFISTGSAAKLSQYFMKKFTEKVVSYKYPQLSQFDPKCLKIQLSLEAYDVKGKKVDISMQASTLKCMCLEISNIVSMEKPSVTYRDIIFKETFIDSQLNVKNNETTGIDAEYLVVTEVIPIHVQWNKHHEAKDSLIPCSLFGNQLDSYGAFFHLHENHIEITSHFSTPIEMRFSEIKEIKTKKSGSVAIAIHLEHSANCLPPFLKRFCLVFWQRGKGCKFVTESLLPAVKEHGISVTTDTIPADIAIRVESLISTKASLSDQSKSPDQMTLIQNHYPTYSSFAPHFMLSNIGSYTYNQLDINPNLVPSTTIEPFIFITILIGIPGSNQENVCSLITDFSQDNNQFIILRQPLGSPELFSASDLQKSLTVLANRGGDLVRIMLIVSAYVEVSEVASAIVHHPNKQARDSCYISCVNTCVDVRNLFICNQTFYPKIMEQCQEGWVNNIIVSGMKNAVKDKKVELLRKLNPNCNIIQVVGNKFIDGDSIEAICALDSFSEEPLPIYRHLASPGWYSQEYSHKPPFLDINYITVTFKSVLCKARFLANLKSLYQKEGRVFVDRIVMSGSIFYVRGRTCFSEDSNIYEVECTPRSNTITLNIAPVKSKPTPPKNNCNCFVFTGYQVTEDQVKTWLQSCVPKPPSKKAMYSKSTLSTEEREVLKKEAKKHKLPEGWFFNGLSYVSMVDGKRADHPMFDDIVEEYVNEKNGEVEKFNKKVDNFNIVSLFKGM